MGATAENRYRPRERVSKGRGSPQREARLSRPAMISGLYSASALLGLFGTFSYRPTRPPSRPSTAEERAASRSGSPSSPLALSPTVEGTGGASARASPRSRLSNYDGRSLLPGPLMRGRW